MKNLLVTGGCGFIGSNYINYIFKKYSDYNIINIDAMYYCASEKNIDEDIRNSQRYRLIKGNLCSYDLVYHIITYYKIDYIIHFAAQSHVQNSFEDALQYTKDNIVGTHNLLEAVRKYGKIKKLIHVSTDEVYGESMIEQNESKKTEKSILCPTNPYAATKASAELIAQSYYYSFGLPIIITRGNNVYGPNQYPEKIIPKFITLLNENKKVTIQGDGSNVRAFIHVEDVVKAFDIILEVGVIGEIYNIGSDDNEEYTVKYVAEMLIKKIKKTDNYDEYIEYINDRPFNDKRYYISNEKIKNLGWNINQNFDEGIDELIKTYESN
jgi:dTDP-glucose 4,6-dehydratase